MQKQHYYGHRERVRKRLLQQGLDGFRDYEALEFLLLFVARRKDMKPVAKALIRRFGSFKNVLDASPEELEEVDEIGPAAATLIHFVKQAAARYPQQTSQAPFLARQPLPPRARSGDDDPSEQRPGVSSDDCGLPCG